MDKKKYPANWAHISTYIRFVRANNRCEWCGVENYQPNPITGSRVVLTVAHLGVPYPDGTPGNKHDKMDVRDENLAALCQRCHLRYDLDEHIHNRKKTLKARKQRAIEASGQQPLWSDES